MLFSEMTFKLNLELEGGERDAAFFCL